jgi:phosphoribosylformylglycinamidine (FGAM) synthase PurS component
MTTQRKNINKEQFFTNHETARRLANWIKEQDWYSSITRTIEPSAGDGAWLDVGLQVDEAYDIDPKHDDVKEIEDWLTYDVGKVKGKTLYVGNPPFGRMGKLAKAFMNHCVETGDYIAFILPAAMAKITQIRQIDPRLHLIHQEDLLDETFRFERDGKVVSTVFQVWERRDELRVDPKKRTSCSDFSFATTTEFTYENALSEFLKRGLLEKPLNKIQDEIDTKSQTIRDLTKKLKLSGVDLTNDDELKQLKLEVKSLKAEKKDLKESCMNILKNFSQRPADVPEDVDIAICTHGSGVGKVHGKNFNSKSTRTHRFIRIENPNLQKEKLIKRLRSLDYESIYKYSTGATCVSKEEIVYLYCKKYLTNEL